MSFSGPDPQPGVLAVHRFARPAGIRRLQRITALSAVALSAAIALWVWLGDGSAVGILGVSLTLTAALWIAWFAGPRQTVRVEYGALVLTAGEREHRIDIAGADLKVVSTPGHRAWRVLFRRPARRPLVVDATMVDAIEFTRVLARWRPDLMDPAAPRSATGPVEDVPGAR